MRRRTTLPRSTQNFLAQQLRDQGLLPRSMRDVKAELRNSGKILPPYEQTDDPTAKEPDTAPLRKSRSYQRKEDQQEAITPIEYGGLQEAYDHFNKELFGGALPDVFITYQRRAHSRGYFGADRFSERSGKSGRHELALNPDHFVDRTDEQICSTQVHEMCHVWQHANGTAPSRGYHNKEWAAKMKSIGLQPSSTGVPGGKETGASVSESVYRTIIDKAARLARAGHSAIVDAVFAKPEERTTLEAAAAAAGVEFRGLFLTTDLPTRLQRIGERAPEASDADAEVARKQEQFAMGAVSWRRIDASGSPAQTLATARAAIM